ncbi:MAG: hypothetical protein HY097_01330 [Nitrospinae bacterium]|nr:hypothetical protein [Nitrospinota bacterium]
MRNIKIRRAFFASLLLFSVAFTMPLNSTSFAASVFELTLTSGGQTYTQGFNNVSDMINGLNLSEIQRQLSSYTDTSAATATLNFRGLQIYASVPANSNTITLSIPSIGVTQTFTGSTRDGSVTLSGDWFKKEGGEAVNKLMNELAKSTAYDPIAGNPNSLSAHIVDSQFQHGFLSEISTLKQVTGEAAPPPSETIRKEVNANLISAGARYGSFKQKDLDVRKYTLPLSYTFRSNEDSRRKLTLNIPIALLDVQGAQSYDLGIGAAISLPVNEEWLLTPSIDYGAVGSVDMGSLGQIVSGSLTSAYTIKADKYTFNIGNMLSYYKTMKLQIGDYSFDPNISNTALRNGIMVSIPTESIKEETALEVFAIDTRYFGSALYIDQYNEVGFSFGHTKTVKKEISENVIKKYLRDLRAGFTYLFSNNSQGFTVNFGYTF